MKRLFRVGVELINKINAFQTVNHVTFMSIQRNWVYRGWRRLCKSSHCLFKGYCIVNKSLEITGTVLS